MRSTTGTDFDLDASAIATGEDKRVVSDQHFVFFNNLTSPDGSIEHTGDNTTGEGEGDDEVPGAWGLWFLMPTAPDLTFAIACFGLGLIGMEFATIFTNSLMPSLAGAEEMGKISGSGFAFGYTGGIVSLVVMLLPELLLLVLLLVRQLLLRPLQRLLHMLFHLQ